MSTDQPPSSSYSKKQIGLLPVLAALFGNIIITILKGIAFFFSGSSSMFSESIHSLADTANQSLLLIGLKRSTKKPTQSFAYGFGSERFFWALISACGIFFLGAGVTIYHGIDTLIAQEKSHIELYVFVILGISLILESITLSIAVRELKKQHPRKKIISLIQSGDPATLAVLLEDSVAVCSIAVAVISIFLSVWTGAYYWDAIGSIIIGILLGVVAVILINKNRELLIGKSMPQDMQKNIIEILLSDPVVEQVIDFKSSTIDLGTYRIKCEIEFNGPMLLKDMYEQDFLKDEFETIQQDYSEFIKFCAEYIDRVPRLMGERINKIEAAIQKEVPQVRHIDIEIN